VGSGQPPAVGSAVARTWVPLFLSPRAGQLAMRCVPRRQGANASASAARNSTTKTRFCRRPGRAHGVETHARPFGEFPRGEGGVHADCAATGHGSLDPGGLQRAAAVVGLTPPTRPGRTEREGGAAEPGSRVLGRGRGSGLKRPLWLVEFRHASREGWWSGGGGSPNAANN
jgi:hypothetical protein